MRCSFIFLAVFLFSSLLQAQSIVRKYQYLTKLNGNFSDFSVDNFNNIYAVHAASGAIVKYNAHGDSVGVYNNLKNYGKLSFIDASNPLKIIFYYKEYLTIVLTDRFLNVTGTINLQKSGILQAACVAFSYDNNIWIYDDANAKIKKIDNQGTVLFESNDLRFLPEPPVMPQALIDDNNILYLYDTQKGWYFFNYFGSLKQQFSFPHWQNVDVKNNLLQGNDSFFLYTYHIQQYQLDTVHTSLPLSTLLKLKEQNEKWYALLPDGIAIYETLKEAP